MTEDPYIIELPFLQYNKDDLIEYMIKNSHYWGNEGYITDYLRPKEHIPILTSIYKQIPEFEMSLQRTFFDQLKPNIFLKPHKDYKRKAAINIPLIGDFDNTPVRFHNDKGSIIYSHAYKDLATVINTSITHSVENSNSYRYILSFSLYLEWADIKQVVKKYLNQSRGREEETH